MTTERCICSSDDIQCGWCARCGAQVNDDGSVEYDGSREAVDKMRNRAAFYDAHEDGFHGSWQDWQRQSEYRR